MKVNLNLFSLMALLVGFGVATTHAVAANSTPSNINKKYLIHPETLAITQIAKGARTTGRKRAAGQRIAANTYNPNQAQDAAVISADSPVEEPTQKKWSNDVLVSVFGQGLDDRVEQTRSAGLGLVGHFRYEPQEWISTDLRILAMIQSGTAHGLSSPTIPRNFFYPLNASVELKPSKYFAIEGGAIGQSQFQNPLLMDIYSFPGLAEKIYAWNDSVARIWFQANQSVPMSTSMTSTSSENEPLPTFLSHTVQIQYTPSKLTKFNLSGGHWVYQNMSSQMAMDSYPFGNTVDGTQFPNYRFRYGFQGFNVSSALEGPVAPGIIPRIAGTYLVNVEAPTGKNMAYSVTGSTKFYTSPTWSITPLAQWYVSESDSSPALFTIGAFDFNTTGFGHNNRQGYSAELRTTHEPQHLTLKARYSDMRLLVQNPQQADTKVIFVGLELAQITLF